MRKAKAKTQTAGDKRAEAAAEFFRNGAKEKVAGETHTYLVRVIEGGKHRRIDADMIVRCPETDIRYVAAQHIREGNVRPGEIVEYSVFQLKAAFDVRDNMMMPQQFSRGVFPARYSLKYIDARNNAVAARSMVYAVPGRQSRISPQRRERMARRPHFGEMAS